MRRTGTLLTGILLLIAQIAQAQTVRPQSDSYWMPSDVQAVGGGEEATSTLYILDDTIGEANIGAGRSDSFDLNAGYRQTVAPAYIAMSCDDVADLGTITLSGQADTTATCTVTTDADAGYSLTWTSRPTRSSLEAHWMLDEASGTSAFDSSGNGRTATYVNSPAASTDVPSRQLSIRSLELDSADTDYLSFSRFTLLSGLTYAAWVKTTSADTTSGYDGNAALNVLGDSTGAVYNGFGVHGGVVRYNHYGSGWQNVTGDTVVNDGEWHHIAVTHDSTTGHVAVYVDGEEDAEGSINYNTTFTAVDRIGAGYSNLDTFDGQLDDVRVYSSALTASEIRHIAQSVHPGALVMSGALANYVPSYGVPVDGLVGHWRMEESSAGSDVLDWSGNENDGTPDGTSGVNNKPAVSTDVPAGVNFLTTHSLNFDGTDDHVSVGDIDALDVGTGDVSMSAWVHFTSTPDTFLGIAGKGYLNSTNGYGLYAQSDGHVGFQFRKGATAVSATSNDVLSDGEWHHLVGVAQRGNTSGVRLYVDGVLQSTTGNPTAFDGEDLSNATSFMIGSRADTIRWFFKGDIDDVRVYMRALTDAEIDALYGTPQSWSVANTESAWGGRLSSGSDDTDAKWGTDDSSEKWLNVGDGSYPLVTRSSRTDEDGSTEVIEFRAEIGAQKIQPAGTYQATVNLTASAL